MPHKLPANVIGHVVYHHPTGMYLDYSLNKGAVLVSGRPEHVPLASAYRRIAVWLEDNPNEDDDFSIDPVIYDPVDKVTDELVQCLMQAITNHSLSITLDKTVVKDQLKRVVNALSNGHKVYT